MNIDALKESMRIFKWIIIAVVAYFVFIFIVNVAIFNLWEPTQQGYWKYKARMKSVQQCYREYKARVDKRKVEVK